MAGMSAEFKLMHISVDGSLANPHVQIAVSLWTLVLATVAAVIITLLNRGLRGRAAAGVVLLLFLSGLTSWIQLRIAWTIQSIAAREMISTTFFHPPPGWLAPTAGIALGVSVGLTLLIRSRHANSRGAA